MSIMMWHSYNMFCLNNLNFLIGLDFLANNFDAFLIIGKNQSMQSTNFFFFNQLIMLF